MADYDIELKLQREGVSINVSGKIDLPFSALEKLIHSVKSDNNNAAEPAQLSETLADEPKHKGRKPILSKTTAYKLLREGKNYDYLAQRYECSRMQVAGYLSWINRKGR